VLLLATSSVRQPYGAVGLGSGVCRRDATRSGPESRRGGKSGSRGHYILGSIQLALERLLGPLRVQGESNRESESKRERGRGRVRERERESMCVCVCV
jgi:hypothetical protein